MTIVQADQAEGRSPRSRLGVAVTAVVLLLSTIPALFSATVLAGLGTSLQPEYPSLGLVLLAACVGLPLFVVGAITAGMTLWPDRARLGRQVLVAALVPWVVAAAIGLPLLFNVCVRSGGACG